MASCRFSKDRAGFGGASTFRLELLGVGDLLLRGGPSTLVKQIKKRKNKVPYTHIWQSSEAE